MPKVSLNGLSVDRYLASFKRDPTTLLGEHRRTLGGAARADIFGVRDRWVGSTIPLDLPTAAFFKVLFEGRGDCLPFEGVDYTERGIPVNYYMGSQQFGITAKVGQDSVTIDSGELLFWNLDFYAPTDDYTIFGWADRGAGAGWEWNMMHATGSGTTTNWLNGVTPAAAPSDVYMLASASQFIIDNSSGSFQANYDDWVILPCKVPTALVASIYAAHQTNEFGIPRMNLGGDLYAARKVRGVFLGSTFMKTAAGLRESVNFALEEDT